MITVYRAVNEGIEGNYDSKELMSHVPALEGTGVEFVTSSAETALHWFQCMELSVVKTDIEELVVMCIRDKNTLQPIPDFTVFCEGYQWYSRMPEGGIKIKNIRHCLDEAVVLPEDVIHKKKIFSFLR